MIYNSRSCSKRKTISIKCDRRQNATRIMEIVQRKTLIPRDQLYLVNQGKVFNDKKTKEESNIEGGATIEMFLRIMGVMKKEELMETSETEEDIKKRKLEELRNKNWRVRQTSRRPEPS